MLFRRGQAPSIEGAPCRYSALSFVLLAASGVACGEKKQPPPQAAAPNAIATEPAHVVPEEDVEQPVTNMQMLVIDAFYDNNPVTYEKEPPEITQARQKPAQERIKTLSPAEVEEIGQLLTHENGTVTYCAAQALDLLDDRAAPAVPSLIATLDLKGSEHHKARARVMRVLGSLGAAALPAKERLQKHLNHSDSRDREAAKEALALLEANDPATPGSRVRPLLLRMAGHDLGDKVAAGQEFAELSQQDLGADLVHLLKSDPNGTVRMMAAAMLGGVKTDHPEVPHVLEQALADEDESIQVKAAQSLGQLGAKAKSAVPAMIDAMKRAKPFHVTTYIKALGEIGPDSVEAVPLLVANLKSDNFMLVDESITALGNIGPAAKDALPALIEQLESADAPTQVKAAEALGKMGPAAEAAVPALKKAQSRFLVDKAAVKALQQIQPDQNALVAGPPDNPADKDRPADKAEAVPRAKLFFETVKQGDIPAVRSLLTTKARPHYASGDIGSMSITVVEDAELTFGEPQYRGDAAAVPVTVRTKEREQKSHLLLRSEFGQWRVYAYRVPDANGRPVLLNLEEGLPTLSQLAAKPSQQARDAATTAEGSTGADSKSSDKPVFSAAKPDTGGAEKLGLSEHFPKDVPVFTKKSRVIMDLTKPGRPIVELNSQSPLPEVYQYYLDQLKANGWKIIKGEQLQKEGGQIDARKEGRTVYIGIHPSKGTCSIKITELRRK